MSNVTCNATAEASAAATSGDATSLVVSILLTVAGAAVLAYSMTVQRYGLAHPERYIHLCGRRIHRLLVWFAGICLYGVANGLKVVAFNLGPFSVLGSVFTVVLVFNLLFARSLLGEALSWPKLASSGTILVGAVTCTIGAPAAAKTVFTPADVSTLFAAHVPFVAALAALMCLAIVGVLFVEAAFPMTDAMRAAQSTRAAARSGRKASAPAGSVLGSASAPVAPAVGKPGELAALSGNVKLPPLWLDRLMALVYPASLGLDESLADLLIRCWTAMLGTCTGGLCDATGRVAMCDVPVVYVSIGMWVLLSFGGSLIWMPVVYRRYEVSVALPFEYGALNLCTVLSGLLFFDEHKYMATWQLALQIAGASVILLGIAIGNIPATVRQTAYA